MSVFAYNANKNSALHVVQLAVAEVDHLFFSAFQSQFGMIGQGPTLWSKASHIFERCVSSFGAYLCVFAWYYDWWLFLKLLDDTRAAINTWSIWNRVVWIEERYTMHCTCHTAGLGCIHLESRCKRPHQVLRSPSAWWAIWWEWKLRYRKEAKTSKWRQCQNQQDVGHETRFGKHKWERTYFMIVWKSWNWPSYSRQCSWYWLYWHMVAQTSLMTVKKPTTALQFFWS
jgi:hypothetical protein